MWMYVNCMSSLGKDYLYLSLISVNISLFQPHQLVVMTSIAITKIRQDLNKLLTFDP